MEILPLPSKNIPFRHLQLIRPIRNGTRNAFVLSLTSFCIKQQL